MAGYFKMFFDPDRFSKVQLERMMSSTDRAGDFLRDAISGDINVQSLIDNGTLICGDPDAVAEQIHKTRQLVGAENLMCIMGIGPMSHDETMKSLRLFGEQVLPRFE
jgi:alkanesulfonate monooxygenase SsuD/methylene tetrahydromethanopterin reductase-like flavin-dependent oxidoreductase (luciferase family)